MSVMFNVLTIIWHILLFAVAVVVFYAVLGIGLSRDPNLGYLLWAAAAAIAAVNIVWLILSVRRMSRR